MAAVTVIKLTGQNHKDIDTVAGQIKTICDTGGITLRHWELRIHKRLLEMDISTGKDENALRLVTKIPIPDTVSIEISMRTVN